MISSDFQNAIVAFSLAAVTAISPHPASEALNVPGEPRIVDGMIVNCFRFGVSDDDEDTLPDDDSDAVIAEKYIEWEDIEIEDECHFINVHDAAGKWRLDLSFHMVLGNEAGPPRAIGISDLLVGETSHFPDEAIVLERITTLTDILVESHNSPDSKWAGSPSILFH